VIKADQSMLLVVLLPEVVMELDELELFVFEVVLLTVMTWACQKRAEPARCRPGRSSISRAA
jgi:hypothetical protein